MKLLFRGAFVALLHAVLLPGVRLEGAVVRPRNGDRALTNPGMGWVYYHFSNRLWAYGGLTEPGDAIDWFPGVSTIYLRVPTIRPGTYDLCVSVGAADATPRLELPLGRELHLRYGLGKITVKRSVLPEKGEK